MKAKKIFFTFMMVWLASLYANAQAELKLIVTAPNFQDFTSGNLTAFKGSDLVKSFTVRNTSNADNPFTGVISYKDNYGGALSVQDIVVTYEGGAIPAGTTFAWKSTGTATLNGSINSGTSYELIVTNLPASIGANKGLIFTRRVKIIDCIDVNSKGQSSIELNVCDINGANCIQMADAWSTGTRLVQYISKAKNEFIDVFDIDVEAHDFCAYNPISPTANSGVRKVSYFTKMHNPTLGETVKDFGIKISSAGEEEIPINDVRIYKAVLNTSTGKYQASGSPLTITPVADPTKPWLAIIKSNPKCFTNVVSDAFFPIGNISGTDAYYVEFNVYNCAPKIDLVNFTVNYYDQWTNRWIGKDDCNGFMQEPASYAAKNKTTTNTLGNPDISNTTYFGPANDMICGGCYEEHVDNNALYIERVSTLKENETGNCRLNNLFVSNEGAFLGAGPGDGVNFQADKARLVIVLKLEGGLDYYTGSDAKYYTTMQFRNPDGNNWLPTNTNGTAVGYNIPTNELPAYDYQKIKMFEFDLTTLYKLYPTLPQSNFDQKSTILYNYLNAADIAYSLTGNCADPKKKEKPNYSVEMYLIADATCGNPLVMPSLKITRNTNIMCPGCQFPGGAGRSVTMKRLNYGKVDNNNNGIPDNGNLLTNADVNTINNDANPDNNIRTNFGIVGDRLQMNTKYYLTGYEDCKGHHFDDLMIGELKYSYLEMTFPYSTFKVDKVNPIKVIITSNSINYTFNVPASVLLTQSASTSNTFEININTINAYKNSSSPDLPADFRFKSYDEIEIEFFMDITENSKTTGAYEEVSFQNMPYFSSTPKSAYVRDFPQFQCDPVLGPVVKDPAGNVIETIPTPPYTNPYYKNTWLNCEGYEAIFNLVRVQQEYWYPDGYNTPQSDLSCNKYRRLSFFSSIGNHNFPKLFNYEFRPAPMIEAVDALIPEGYQFTNIQRWGVDDGKTVPIGYAMSYYQGSGIQSLPASKATIGGINYTLLHLDIPGIYTNVTDVEVSSGTQSSAMRQVDEHIRDDVYINYEAVCSKIPAGRTRTPDQPKDTSALGLQYRFKTFFDLDPITDSDVIVSRSSGNDLATPVNQLSSTLTSTGIVAVTTRSFNFDFSLNNGSNGSPAKFPFVTITYDQTKFNPITLSSSLINQVTELKKTVSGDIVSILYGVNPLDSRTYMANTLDINKSIALKITGGLAQCINDAKKPATFIIGYGWDCNAFPNDFSNLTNLCYYDTLNIKAYSIASGILGNVSSTDMSGDCSNPKIHFTHNLTSTGSEVNNVKYNIDFPDGLTLDTNSIVIKYGSAALSRPVFYGVKDNSTTSNKGIYNINLKDTAFSTVPFAGAVVQGARNETITLEFDAKVASGCNTYVPTSKTSILTTGSAFCGTTLSELDTIVPTYKACPDSFSVNIIGGTVICGNEASSAPIVLKAVVPNTPGNCVTYPLTYEWTKVGSSTILGTADSLIVKPTMNSTYQVVVHDAAGRSAIDQHTISVGFEYDIADVKWVCGSKDKNICVPINALVPVRKGIIGMDFTLRYDKRYVSPVITISSSNLGKVVLNGGYPGTYAISVNTTPSVETDKNIGHANISIYYNSHSGPGSPQFVDSGLVICVPFTVEKTPAAGTTFDFTMREMYESYTYFERPVCWDKGTFKITGTGTFAGTLEYYQPYKKTGGISLYQGLTHTIGTTNGALNTITVLDSCGGKVLGTYKGTNSSNNFIVPVSSSKNVIQIKRDINNNTKLNFLDHVNARDTRAMEYITTLNNYSCVDQMVLTSCPGIFIPTAGQMVAADVNMSDSVRANDITQLQRRLVGEITEFKQVQNQKGKPSLDWRFIDPDILTTNPDFTISTKYPFNDGKVRYWRDNVPNVPECITIQEQCADSPNEIFRGILLGDVVNYTSKYYTSNLHLKTEDADKVLSPFTFNINLQKAEKLNSTDYRIAVNYFAPDTAAAYGFDLGLEYNPQTLKIVDMTEDISISGNESHFMWNNDASSNYLRSTNYTPVTWDTKGTCYYITVRKLDGQALTINDLKTGYGMINGDWANVEIVGKGSTNVNSPLGEGVMFELKIFPSPVVNESKITYHFTSADEHNYIEISNVLGQSIYKTFISEKVGTQTVLAQELSKGVYFCTIHDAQSKQNKTIKFIVE